MFGLYFLNKTDLEYWKYFLDILLIGQLFHLMCLHDFDVSFSHL